MNARPEQTLVCAEANSSDDGALRKLRGQPQTLAVIDDAYQTGQCHAVDKITAALGLAAIAYASQSAHIEALSIRACIVAPANVLVTRFGSKKLLKSFGYVHVQPDSEEGRLRDIFATERGTSLSSPVLQRTL